MTIETIETYNYRLEQFTFSGDTQRQQMLLTYSEIRCWERVSHWYSLKAEIGIGEQISCQILHVIAIIETEWGGGLLITI